MTFRYSLILVSAITAALAAPLAFAQQGHASATAQGQVAAQTATPAMPATPAIPATPPTEDAGAMASSMPAPAVPATAAIPPTDDATEMGATAATPAIPATPALPAATSSSAKRVNWSQLDSDKDGKLSKTEAAAVKSLSKVFDQADSNKDGALSADEYKAYLAARGKGSHGDHS